MVVKRFDVYLVTLDPTIGSETPALAPERSAGASVQKTRPCLVVSPDEMNRHIATVIVAPMTTKGQPYPSRVPCQFDGKDGQVVLDQLRTVDKTRLVRFLGRIDAETQTAVLDTLAKMFAP